MTDAIRAVCDTNIYVSATLSRNLASPTREVLQRWQRDEFVMLTCEAIASELAEILLRRQIPTGDVEALLALLYVLAEWVEVRPEAVERLLSDADDDVVVACALLGPGNPPGDVRSSLR